MGRVTSSDHLNDEEIVKENGVNLAKFEHCMNPEKLYKYRPLSPFLFKELQYQELYFASCLELNDPLDLRTTVEYKITDREQADALAGFLFKGSFSFNESDSKEVWDNNRKIASFCQGEKLEEFRGSLYDSLVDLQENQPTSYEQTAKQAILRTIKKFDLDFSLDIDGCFDNINRLSKLFLNNSHVTCFSEDPSSFLMWSYYAGSHQGICLEFTLCDNGTFPFERTGNLKFEQAEIQKGFAEVKMDAYVTGVPVWKVTYQNDEQLINFFDFAPVFENEGDADLQGLSKSRWHGYAHELRRLFCSKKSAWAHEKEWRVIDINFSGEKQPEERIRHYPVQALSAIYFGANTPEIIKKRIFKLYREKHYRPQLFDAVLNNEGSIEFYEFEVPEGW